jgi:hypothetical protein
MQPLDKWLAAYAAALPSDLRPDVMHSGYRQAAAVAAADGWAPEQAADHVAAGDYAGARSRPAVALARLERIGPVNPDPVNPDAWRAFLPAVCPHAPSHALGITRPNLCIPCRQTAGEGWAGPGWSRRPGRSCGCGEQGCDRADSRIPALS